MTSSSVHPSSFTVDRQGPRTAFTLNELLIVIALAVLVLGIAVAAFNVITSGRTIDSAENQLSSYVAAVRTQAIGLQEPRGVILFKDVTDRVVVVPIYYAPNHTRPVVELVGDREEMSLPVGVGLQAVPNASVGNKPKAFPWNEYAVILFDGDGTLLQEGVRVISGTSVYERLPANVRTTLGPAIAVNSVPPPDQTSNIGFVLYNKPDFDVQPASKQDDWMKENAVPYLINRYNGTLLRGE